MSSDEWPPDNSCQYDDDLPSSDELALLIERGGAFDWLLDEPDLYTLDDGEPV